MIVHIGDNVVPIGQTSPAQARILVKKELASWKDGSLLLLLRPAFAELVVSNEHLMKGPFDDENTSKAELDRRLQWFKQLMVKGADALAATGQPASRNPDELSFIEAKGLSWLMISTVGSDVGDLTQEEVDEFFKESDTPSLTFDAKSLAGHEWSPTMLEEAPDVYAAFGIQRTDVYCGPGLSGHPDPLGKQEAQEVFSDFRLPVKWGKAVEKA